MSDPNNPKTYVHIPVPMPALDAPLPEILKWINDSPTPAVRNIRKRQMYHRLYSSGPVSFQKVYSKILGD